jgi:hypothetical protein
MFYKIYIKNFNIIPRIFDIIDENIFSNELLISDNNNELVTKEENENNENELKDQQEKDEIGRLEIDDYEIDDDIDYAAEALDNDGLDTD